MGGPRASLMATLCALLWVPGVGAGGLPNLWGRADRRQAALLQMRRVLPQEPKVERAERRTRRRPAARPKPAGPGSRARAGAGRGAALAATSNRRWATKLALAVAEPVVVRPPTHALWCSRAMGESERRRAGDHHAIGQRMVQLQVTAIAFSHGPPPSAQCARRTLGLRIL